MWIVALYVKIRARLLRRKTSPADIVLIGGSSTEYWRTSAQDLLPCTSHNFGIGGSTTRQWVTLAQALVPPCAPKAVFIYAGANDLHMCKDTPQAAFQQLEQLCAVLMQLLPEAKLYYAGVYLTKKYRSEWDADHAYNQLAQAFAQRCDALEYIDIPAVLADENGQPLQGIFRKDGEHLNEQGYALWRDAIAAKMG